MNKIIKTGNANIVIMCDDLKNIVPLGCPICQILIRDRTDVIAYRKYSCCSLCELEIVHPNQAKWKNNWRPSKKELGKLRKKRKLEPSYLMFK
tara:strand:+ start:659 stop:937 length:279 start_codon:yes stop_codon:yes gene_type:complete